MFEDFQEDSAPSRPKGQAALSLAGSVLIFSVVLGGIAAAIATARAVVSEPRPVEVEFSALPLPEPPPAPEPEPEPQPEPERPRPQAAQRRRARNVTNTPPREIPTERPSESEGELVEATDTGPVEGFTDGGGSSDAPVVEPADPEPEPVDPAPQQREESISRPSYLSGCATPTPPLALSEQAETIRIEVRMLIGSDGNVQSATIVESHPLIPDELILNCARAQTFRPATLPDGTPVPFPFRRRFVFRPASGF